MRNRAFSSLFCAASLRAGGDRLVSAARRAASVRPYVARLAQFALPNLCALCGNLSRNLLCDGCDSQYWNEPRLRCTTCAVALDGRRRAGASAYRCGDCLASPPAFDATFALADYRAPLDALALGLKFRARLMLAREFARRLASLASDALDQPQLPDAQLPDVIAPVPLSRQRLIERGYNQAWEIARPLAATLGVRGDALLARRVIDTAPQSRLDPEARRLNVGCAFDIARPVHGLHVALVDDVMTTGATLEALARVLKARGARRVTNFVVLRTPKI